MVCTRFVLHGNLIDKETRRAAEVLERRKIPYRYEHVSDEAYRDEGLILATPAGRYFGISQIEQAFAK